MHLASITKRIFIAGMVCLLMLVVVACKQSNNSSENWSEPKKESVYERVLRTGTIRAGYAMYPPYCMKDANTGKLTGIFVDALEQAGKNLGFKIDWAEEVGWATMIEGLETNRYDIVPTGVWPNAIRAKHADFTVPLFFSTVGAYVRADDKRFDKSLDQLNNPSMRIAIIDGYVTEAIAKRRFPRANFLSHPDMSDSSGPLLDVVNKKADITFEEPGIVALFLKNNPGSVRNIAVGKPVSIFGNTMMFKINQPAFKSMLNATLIELLHEGFIDRLIKKYQPEKGIYYPVADPYQLPK